MSGALSSLSTQRSNLRTRPKKKSDLILLAVEYEKEKNNLTVKQP